MPSQTEVTVCMTPLLLLLSSGLVAAPPDGVLRAATGSDKAAGEFLEISRVWKAEIRLTEEAWKTMQPKGGGPPGFGAPPDPAKPVAFKFTYDFTYVRGSVAFADDTLSDVGIRFKGNGSYWLSALVTKRPFRLDFNRFNEDGTFRGLKALSLNNNVVDASKVREAMAYEVYRAAGVHAPRTTFVELSLNVPGKHDHQLLGVYTAVEPIDKAFLKRQFKNGQGMLLKPEKLAKGLEDLGDDWAPYADRYGPKDEPTVVEKRRLMAFVKLLNKADDATFRKEVGAYLDVENFLRFLAATTFLSQYDSFIGTGHNYHLYLNPETNKFVFLPWDADLAFGAFYWFGSPVQLADASILHPHAGDNKLIDRLLAIPETKARYLELFKTLNGTAFEPSRLAKVIAECEAAVKEPVARELKANPKPFPFGNPMAPTAFVTARTKSIAAQLAGEKTGFQPKPLNFGAAAKPFNASKCVEACKACAAACEACAKQATEPAQDACAKLCTACSRACLLCVELSAAKSPLTVDACSLCEKLCLECARVCGKFEGASFKDCAKACQDCAKACVEARR